MLRRFFAPFILLMLMSTLCLAKTPFIIALDADLSAVAKAGGIAIQRGATIAIDEINAAGGVLGHPLTLQSFDHRGNPARGVANIKKIAALDNVAAVLGGVHTPVAMQELETIHKHQLIYLDPWAAGTPIVDNGYRPNYVFRVSVRDAEAGKVLIHAAKRDGATKVALLLEKTGWGRSNEASMTDAASKLDIEVVATQWFNWKQKHMKSEFEHIRQSGAQAIMLVANAPEGATILNEALSNPHTRSLNLYSHWGIASGKFVEAVGLEKLRQANLKVLQSYSFLRPSNPERNQQVIKAYQDTFDHAATPRNISGAVGVAQSYDLVYLLKLAIEKAGTFERPAVRDALENLEPYRGLIKDYSPAFESGRHDALWADDYFMTQYDQQGFLVPERH